MLDLKTSCQALLAMKCHESHMSGIGTILIVDDSTLILNVVSRDKKSASMGQLLRYLMKFEL